MRMPPDDAELSSLITAAVSLLTVKDGNEKRVKLKLERHGGG